MNKLISFVKQFTKKEVKELNSVEKIGRKYFYMSEELKKIRDSIPLEPYAAGIPIGELVNNDFKPSIALIDIISKYTDRKIFINKKGETMFLYKRSVFGENFVKDMPGEEKGVCIVLNENEEVLGYGEVNRGNIQTILKAMLDRGDFLRREREK